jgi:hypothetical protein
MVVGMKYAIDAYCEDGRMWWSGYSWEGRDRRKLFRMAEGAAEVERLREAEQRFKVARQREGDEWFVGMFRIRMREVPHASYEDRRRHRPA